MKLRLENRLRDLEAPYKEMDDPYAVEAWILRDIDIPEAEKMIQARFPKTEVIIVIAIGNLWEGEGHTLEQLKSELKKNIPKERMFLRDKNSHDQYVYALKKVVGDK